MTHLVAVSGSNVAITIGAVLLWFGVGLLALAIVFLTTSLLAPPADSAAVDDESATLP